MLFGSDSDSMEDTEQEQSPQTSSTIPALDAIGENDEDEDEEEEEDQEREESKKKGKENASSIVVFNDVEGDDDYDVEANRGSLYFDQEDDISMGSATDNIDYGMDDWTGVDPNEGEVDKLEGMVTFADSIVITDATASLTMSFNLGEGMSLNSGGGDAIHIGSGPFQAIFTTN